MNHNIFPPLPPDPPPTLMPPPPPPPPPSKTKQEITANNGVLYSQNWNYFRDTVPPLCSSTQANSFRKPQLNQSLNPRFNKPRWPRPPPQSYQAQPRHNPKRRYPSNNSSGQSSKKRKPTEHLEFKYTAEEAERAIQLERTYQEEANKHYIRLTFPDIEFNREIAMSLNENFENVHFYNSHERRMCLLKIHESYDRDRVIEDLKRTQFGSGYLYAERKQAEHNCSASDIIPLSLYVTQLEDSVSEEDLKKLYPKSANITIKFEKRNKNHDKTKTARVDFSKVEHAFDAFKASFWCELNSKKINVRFYNNKASHGMPTDIIPSKVQKSSEFDSIDSQSTEDKRVRYAMNMEPGHVKEEPRDEFTDYDAEDSIGGLSEPCSEASTITIKDEVSDYETSDSSSTTLTRSVVSSPRSYSTVELTRESTVEENNFDDFNEDIKPDIRILSEMGIGEGIGLSEGLSENNEPIAQIVIKQEEPDEIPDSPLHQTNDEEETKVKEDDVMDDKPRSSGIRVKQEFCTLEPGRISHFDDWNMPSFDCGLSGLSDTNSEIIAPVIKIEPGLDDIDELAENEEFPKADGKIKEEGGDEENEMSPTHDGNGSAEEDLDIDDLLRNFKRKREMRRKLDAIFKS